MTTSVKKSNRGGKRVRSGRKSDIIRQVQLAKRESKNLTELIKSAVGGVQGLAYLDEHFPLILRVAVEEAIGFNPESPGDPKLWDEPNVSMLRVLIETHLKVFKGEADDDDLPINRLLKKMVVNAETLNLQFNDQRDQRTLETGS